MEAMRPREGEMAGMEIRASGPAADLRRMNDRILLKMALERKDYRRAREETLAEEQAKAALEGSASTEVDVVEIRGLRVQVVAPNGRASVEIVALDIRALHATFRKEPPPRKDPLLLDLGGGGPRTTGEEGARDFDLQGDGRTAPTSFAAEGSAFLALDRNGNGSIDSGLELFGDQHGASDGFAELARFDDNGDGRIDAGDAVFGRLQLLYGDGRTGSLSEGGVTAIGLGSSGGYELDNGDAVLRSGSAYRSDGSVLGAYAMALRQYEV